jgi:hypothetical protein
MVTTIIQAFRYQKCLDNSWVLEELAIDHYIIGAVISGAACKPKIPGSYSATPGVYWVLELKLRG